MGRLVYFLVRRALAGLFTVWAIVTLAFFAFWAIPSQPAQFVYPFSPHLTDYQIKQADHLLGIDRPHLTLYVDYLWKLLHGDFGSSWASYAQIPGAIPTAGAKFTPPGLRSQLFAELGVTLSIVLGGALLVLLLAVPLGAIAGSRLRSLGDRTISLVALIGVCTHPMVIALILRSTIGRHLHWAPDSGYCPLSGLHLPAGVVISPGTDRLPTCNGVADWASHLALPWITFTLLFLALYTRIVRASVADTMPEDFVRTARAKGAGEARVIGRHVLPNAALRVLTMIGMEVGTAIGVCAYIETAFAMNGLGLAGIRAMLGLDLPEILAVVTTITLIVVIANLIVDALYAIIDPRIRFSIDRTQNKHLAGGVI